MLLQNGFICPESIHTVALNVSQEPSNISKEVELEQLNDEEINNFKRMFF